MIVAAGSGERDLTVDSAILTESVKGNVAPDFLNTRLQSDLRPTLFLAQLSNLLAGNISIVHGVTGSSRTFMGEEASSIDAVRIALARIASGQSDIALVGAAHNAERKDLLLVYEFGKFNLRERYAPVWSRGPNGGFALGSGGAFLVLESKRHAQARGAKPFAKLSTVVADHARRNGPKADSAVMDSLETLWTQLHAGPDPIAIITGATGAEPATSQERRFLERHKAAPIRASGSRFGHLMEAQFPLGLALAALSVSKGELFPASDTTGLEIASSAPPSQIVVIGTGHWRGEGMALVEAAD
jgi:3-oxoacyl-[acyl-carrier-protein] synthase II